MWHKEQLRWNKTLIVLHRVRSKYFLLFLFVFDWTSWHFTCTKVSQLITGFWVKENFSKTFPSIRRNKTSQTLCAGVEPADLCSFAVSYYSFMRRSLAVERCLANYFEMDAGCRMTRSIRFSSHFFFFQQTMP